MDQTFSSSDLRGILPWTRSCFVCGESNPHGLQLHSRVEGDTVRLTHTAREADLGWRHIVHGGILMTLMDEVMTWAAIIRFGHGCVAAEISIKLKHPVASAEVITVEGCVVKAQSRLLLTESQVLSHNGTVVATASGKYVPMKDKEFSLCIEDFVEGSGTIDVSQFLQTRNQSG